MTTVELFAERPDNVVERLMCVERQGWSWYVFQDASGARFQVRMEVDWREVADRYEAALDREREYIRDLKEQYAIEMRQMEARVKALAEHVVSVESTRPIVIQIAGLGNTMETPEKAEGK